MYKQPLLPSLAALAGLLLLPLIFAMAIGYAGSIIPVGTCRPLDAPNELCLAQHKPVPQPKELTAAAAAGKPDKATRYAITGPITTLNKNGTVRVNNLACLEALFDIASEGLRLLLVGGGGWVLAVRQWRNNHAGPHRKLWPAAAAVALGMAVPVIVYMFFRGLTEAALFN